jgi:pimeloyl-ACP methyl ester carboxylesterase
LSDFQNLPLKDGRILGYAEYGDPAGTPVISFHGMPGSRLVMKVAEEAAGRAHARLIAPDRPGYGKSSPRPRSTLLDYVDDILELADSLNFERFAVLGVSGGGPFPLACAYRNPERVTVAALISGIGPLSLPNSTRDMVQTNSLMFRLGRLSPALAGWVLTRLIRSSLPNMEKHVRAGTSPSPDLSPQVFAVMAADQAEAICAGPQGIAFDMSILWQPWGFQFEDIRSKVLLWHGEADNLAPAHLAHTMADRIPDCEAVFYPGESHTDPLVRHMDEILARIVSASRLLNGKASST